ncbi:MAG: sugar phosphate isomerase/epimerase [Firmicutes bacterium]|nr:sugar phosphate isomerase/epimerase [Bacillota bacterium]
MKIGFNGATTMKSADLVRDVEISQAAGYDVLEIWGAKLNEYLTSRSVADLKALFESARIKPYSINSIEFITFKKGSEWDNIVRLCHEYCRIASAIGCPNVVVVPSPKPQGVSSADIAHESARALAELSRIAEGYGVHLAFEFLGFEWCSVTTLRQCNEIVEQVNRPNIGMVLDTFHFFAGGSQLESIDAVDPKKLFIFHINDAEPLPKNELQDANRLLPGDGVIPLREIVARLKHIGYDAVASVELFRPEYWQWDPEVLARTAWEKTRSVIGA